MASRPTQPGSEQSSKASSSSAPFPSSTPTRRKKNQWLNLDMLAVFAFVIIGRNNHDEGLTLDGLLRTAAPFVIGLIVGWALSKAWDRATDVRTGVIVWAATLVIGMFVRRVFYGDGIAPSFVAVATVFLGVTLVGWRAVHLLVSKRRAA